MTSSVDTNILLDILLPDLKFLDSSKELLKRAILKGKAIISEVVYAELCAQFDKKMDIDAFLGDVGIIVQHSDHMALWHYGKQVELG